CVLRELHIASSTYYRWRRAEREPCERVRRDADDASAGDCLGEGCTQRRLNRWLDSCLQRRAECGGEAVSSAGRGWALRPCS
ncbi:hypothetical protein ACFVRD_49390, partial [Streptomyces sp. NPDC057908]|uniref:hypothetical protein n=1 Tax=Streptomyces sp. NPDC057908 TaxID=3346276 RepID=UPI0036E8A0F3